MEDLVGGLVGDIEEHEFFAALFELVVNGAGVSTIALGAGGDLQVVGNLQARKATESHALQMVEQVMTSIAPFNSPTGAVTITNVVSGSPVSATASPGVATGIPGASGYAVTISSRVCMHSAPASGYSAVSTIAPEDNIWEFDVLVTDSFTGARSHVVQGAKIRQLAGACS